MQTIIIVLLAVALVSLLCFAKRLCKERNAAKARCALFENETKRLREEIVRYIEQRLSESLVAVFGSAENAFENCLLVSSSKPTKFTEDAGMRDITIIEIVSRVDGKKKRFIEFIIDWSNWQPGVRYMLWLNGQQDCAAHRFADWIDKSLSIAASRVNVLTFFRR